MSKPKRKPTTARRKQRPSRERAPFLALGALVLGGLIVLGLLWAGTSSPSSVAARGGAQTGSAVGQLAPAFRVQDVEGHPVSPEPGRPTVLFFMAAWCTSCAAEEQALLWLYRDYGESIQIISVDVDERSDSPADLRRFRTRFGGPWSHVLNARLALDFRVKTLDTTLILDPQGRIVYRDARPTDYDTLKRALEKIL